MRSLPQIPETSLDWAARRAIERSAAGEDERDLVAVIDAQTGDAAIERKDVALRELPRIGAIRRALRRPSEPGWLTLIVIAGKTIATGRVYLRPVSNERGAA